MTQGCIALTRDAWTRWRVAAGRGVILGAAVALHLLVVALVWRAPVPRETVVHVRASQLPLRVRLLTTPPRPAAPPPRRMRHDDVRPRQTVIPTVTPVEVSSAKPVAASPSPPALTEGTDDYHAPLQDAARRAGTLGARAQLPGSNTHVVTGIPLRKQHSLQQTVRAMTVGSRCKYSRLKMAGSSQFITRQQIDRLLEADGCGAHREHTAADDTVDALTDQVIFTD